MERVAKEAEQGSASKMNSDVQSDTERWHAHKRSTNDNNQQRRGNK